jgi:hypothetical protein
MAERPENGTKNKVLYDVKFESNMKNKNPDSFIIDNLCCNCKGLFSILHTYMSAWIVVFIFLIT